MGRSLLYLVGCEHDPDKKEKEKFLNGLKPAASSVVGNLSPQFMELQMSQVKLGRPVFFKGHLAKNIVAVVKANGLTRGRIKLATEGVQQKPGGAKEPISISLPTLGKLAEAAGVKLTRGRPKLKAA